MEIYENVANSGEATLLKCTKHLLSRHMATSISTFEGDRFTFRFNVTVTNTQQADMTP